MRHLSGSLAITALLATTATVAHADAEISALGGVHVFNENNELGVKDVAGTGQKNAALFGLRLSGLWGDVLGVEAELGMIPSEARDFMDESHLNFAYRGQMLLQAFGVNPAHKVIPFFVLGAGAMTIKSTDGDRLRNDTDPVPHTGVGFKVRLGGGFGLRIDGRMLFPPSTEDTTATIDFEAMASVYKSFRTSSPVAVEKPVPRVVDADGDGVLDVNDKCINESEDRDGYQDDDGCPEADNDQDGILDGSDKCPLEAEDKDDYADTDGCPEADNDQDGILDATDKCPVEAEDKDSFQDDDGCPENDNDNDGLADGVDKCPIEPETKNGFQDEDGCPDELPAKVAAYTGVIKGVNFATNSDTLLKTSFKTLDKAVEVLKEFPDLKIEIQGHTDDTKIKKNKKFEDNTALSFGRAESVKAYFVKNGIAAERVTTKGLGSTVPVTIPDGLKGRKLTAARAQNRRVEFRLVSSLTQ
jgi:outer membrane protein OmpA-like peptidoglycan-associated protein